MTSPMTDAASHPRGRRLALIAGAVAAGALVGLAGVYGIGTWTRNAGERHLADWQGRTVLINLWATWCIPCRQEMPALDALETTLGNERFEVVAVNIDSRDTAKPQAWLKEVGVKTLAYYTDPSGKVFQDLKLVGRGFGLPTTVLVDPQRCEIGTAAGPAEWASQDGIALVRAALGG